MVLLIEQQLPMPPLGVLHKRSLIHGLQVGKPVVIPVEVADIAEVGNTSHIIGL